VRPRATLGDYKGLAVAKPSSDPDEGAVDAELETLRERQARLETVEEAAADGDFLVVDYAGSIDGELFEGGTARDQMIELGSGRLIPGFEDGLVGAAAGDERTLELSFPDDYPQQALAGKAASFEVSVKEVKRKQLAELDDAFAEQAAGFDTLDELREDIASKLREGAERQADSGFRESVLDAAVANATVEVPEALIDARAAELWDRMMHSLSHQGINKELYLQITGRTEEEMLAEAKPDAEQGLKREAVLTAVIEAENLVATDGDVLDALQDLAAREGLEPEKLRDRLDKAGRLDEVREDIVQRQALELLVEHATALEPEDAERAAAREKIWTPGDA
jgi:trigger factor